MLSDKIKPAQPSRCAGWLDGLGEGLNSSYGLTHDGSGAFSAFESCFLFRITKYHFAAIIRVE
jgi:hypothetical protein